MNPARAMPPPGARAWRGAAKVVLAVATLLCLSSMGGLFLVTPALLPLQWWAARRSTVVGRVGWGLLAGQGMAMTAWAAVYTVAGEPKPTIWLVPSLVLVGVAVVFWLRATPVDADRPAPLVDRHALVVLRRPDGRFTAEVRLLLALLAAAGAIVAFALGAWLAN